MPSLILSEKYALKYFHQTPKKNPPNKLRNGVMLLFSHTTLRSFLVPLAPLAFCTSSHEKNAVNNYALRALFEIVPPHLYEP